MTRVTPSKGWRSASSSHCWQAMPCSRICSAMKGSPCRRMPALASRSRRRGTPWRASSAPSPVLRLVAPARRSRSTAWCRPAARPASPAFRVPASGCPVRGTARAGDRASRRSLGCRTRGCRARRPPARASPGGREAPQAEVRFHQARAVLVRADVAREHQQVRAGAGGPGNPDRTRDAGRRAAVFSWLKYRRGRARLRARASGAARRPCRRPPRACG